MKRLQAEMLPQTMKLPQAWSQLGAITGNFLRPSGLRATHEALTYCQFTKEAVLLDVGCGLGGTIEHLQALAYNCIGLDISQELLMQQARRLAIARNENLGLDVVKGESTNCIERIKSSTRTRPLLMQGDSRNLPLQSASVEGIFCECVLSLLEKPAAILQDFYRILHDGGKLILTDIIRKEHDPKLKNTEVLATPNSHFVDFGACPTLQKNVEDGADMAGVGLLPDLGQLEDVVQYEQLTFSCLDGALPLANLRTFLLDVGFTIRLESDYSRSLAELSALLVLHDMRFEDVFFSHTKACDCTRDSNFGYILIVAEKL